MGRLQGCRIRRIPHRARLVSAPLETWNQHSTRESQIDTLKARLDLLHG
jgi:hypothetical protein